MPRSIVERASHILSQLEQKSIDNDVETLDGITTKSTDPSQIPAPAMQLSIFETGNPTAAKLKKSLEEIDLNSMTPIECMMKLSELKKLAEKE
jgi:DNA mismatch repair protein MutS